MTSNKNTKRIYFVNYLKKVNSLFCESNNQSQASVHWLIMILKSFSFKYFPEYIIKKECNSYN